MRAFLPSPTRFSTSRSIITSRVCCFSSKSCLGTLVSVGKIRDDVSKFVVRSCSTNPFLNLAIEEQLLRASEANTRILFTYVNRPCVVIGRNQNPWLEVNLAALKKGMPKFGKEDGNLRQKVLLLRRRSGGGTVFHDEGNLNYCFIVPNDGAFSRDKHAEMVVRAIQQISPAISFQGEQVLPLALTRGIRVNNRHDIVMPARVESDSISAGETQTVKVSGSAYKLTRGRALHHGTLLFSSPNLKSIGSYLHSPARGYINAKGVESVRSPIGNLRFSHDPSMRDALKEELEQSIARVFGSRYPDGKMSISTVDEADTSAHDAISAGTDELQSQDWIFLQTPAFTFTNQHLAEDKFTPAPQPRTLPASTRLLLKAKHGLITQSHISLSDDRDIADAEAQQLRTVLQNKKLHTITDWEQLFAGMDKWTHPSTGALTAWLSELFPPVI